METKTNLVLKLMNILAWIVFVGLCISTGTLLYAIIVSLFINSAGIIDPVNGLDFYALKQLGSKLFINVTSLMVVVSILKAYLFYLVIRIFMKINLEQPFSITMTILFARISYVAFSIGLISYIATSYIWRLTKQNTIIQGFLEPVNGFHEFLFFAGIIFIISLIFKRGIEIQSENELTI